MLEVLKTMMKTVLHSSISNNMNQTQLGTSNNQSQSNVRNTKAAYLRLGRLMMYCAGISGLNAVRTTSTETLASTFNMPILKHINNADNYLTVIMLQQCIFMGVCSRFDTSVPGKTALTIIQCLLLSTSFYKDFKAASIACSLAICLPLKYSKATDFSANVKAAIKEVFNFEQGI